MKPQTLLGQALTLSLIAFLANHSAARAAEANPAAPTLKVEQTTNGAVRLSFPMYPGAQGYSFSTSGDVTNLTPSSTAGRPYGQPWTVTNPGPAGFFKLAVTPMSSNDLFAATVLNRLTYGPTPDDIDLIRTIGPEQFIAEQLAPESIVESINTDPPITNTPLPGIPLIPLTNWIRVEATGTAGGQNFGIYLSGAGSVYIDNVWLVAGTNAESGPNLLLNGDFEEPVVTPPWTNGSAIRSSVATNSPTVDGLAFSGTNCLRLTASASASSLTAGFWQSFATNTPASTQKFTLSFYYLPVQNTNALDLIARVSQGGASGGTTGRVSLPVLPPPPPTPPVPPPAISATYAKLTNVATANLDDLRAWHVYRAIHSKRQLHEVLAQFFQNHLTTQFQKTQDYFDASYNVGAYTNTTLRTAVALDFHWREHKAIRDALLDPNCTFYDLLKVSIESPAMIIYLDTQVNSKAAPNQNYAREIMELSSMGADNGYIQQDIVDLSKVWTGWRVAKKDPTNAASPFTVAISGSNTNIADTPGLWVLHFNTNQHDTTTKRLFTNSPIDARFGAAFGAGQSYALILSNTLATGTNGFAEGYKVAQHLANLPYTMEFVSVKLCRLFVHENFYFGTNDYTAPNLSPEVQLVKDCMTAWNTPAGDGRKGNIRSVLNTIFSSALFRGHGASQQKVKTPIEYSVSAIRALRVLTTDTNGWLSATADSDGYGLSGKNGNTTPLSRMGGMMLFDKPEPDGYSEFGRIWLNTANLCERMRYAQHLVMATTSTIKDDDYGSAGLQNTSDPVKLLKLKLPAASWTNDAAVVDFFLGLLYPGEGLGNMDRDRSAAIDYLNTNEAGTAASAFTSLVPTTAGYDGRVRSMVGFLLSLPRFQEQ